MGWVLKDELLFNITFWILLAVTLLSILIRIYVRVHVRGSILNRRSWHWSDIFLVIAWLGFLSSGILNLIMFVTYDYVPTGWEKHSGEKKYFIVRKLDYAYVVSLWTWLFCVKASLLCFFNELVARHVMFKTWVAIRVVGFIVAAGGITVTLYGALWCQPVSRQWAPGTDYCWYDFTGRFRMTVFRQMCHVVTDVMVIAIPLPLLPLLRNLSHRQRIGVGIMFTLGLFCTVVSIIFTLGVLQWDNGSFATTAAASFLQYEPPVELAASILIQCVPAIRVFPGLLGRRRKKSLVEMGSSRRTMVTAQEMFTTEDVDHDKIHEVKESKMEITQEMSLTPEKEDLEKPPLDIGMV